jgi:vancomycin resistance protein YoaR
MKNAKTKSYYLIFNLIILGSLAFNVEAYNKDSKLGFFKNDDLQEILEKPFYLFGENKENAIPFYLKDFINWEYKIVYDQNYRSEIENPLISQQGDILKNAYLELTQTYDQKISYRKSSEIYLKEQETKDFLESISKDINQEAIEARFKFNPKTESLDILRKDQAGIELEVENSLKLIKKTLAENPKISYIPLDVKENPPRISSENIEKYQIKKLIGVGKSDFTGSSSTRIHNINTGSKRFNGLILEPDEEFSFTTILGEVDENTGYKEELVIKKNQTVPEYGGGICQVSTTMFRVALNSGMKITERHNHSYPVHYYNPPGTDATVYVPKPDLKFKNTTGNYLLIETELDEKNKEYFINFYSKEDLYDVEIEGPEVTERTADGKIRTSLKQIVKNKKTNEDIFQDVFKSFYDNPDNYPSPDEIILEKPKDWSGKQWDEYYAKFGAIIEEMKKKD